MSTEIIEVIRELGQTSCWEKASVIIGGISTLLTFVVLWYNHKSIKLTQQTMRQAIGLQLYEKRLELYSTITDEKAFSKAAPISLKIVYTEDIYQLYSEIVELCDERWNKIMEFSLVFPIADLEKMQHGNICQNLYNLYLNRVEQALQLEARYDPTDCQNIRQIFSLKKHKEEIVEIHRKICEKYPQLEEKMRTMLNQSMKI